MAIRVQVADDDSGTSAYTFAVNPSVFDTKDNPNTSDFDSLYAGKIHSKLVFDNRPRKLTWEGFPVSRTDISSIVDYFRLKEGQIKYFNFKDLDGINYRWPSLTTWNKARIISVSTKIRKGGNLVYNDMTLIIQPEQ